LIAGGAAAAATAAPIAGAHMADAQRTAAAAHPTVWSRRMVACIVPSLLLLALGPSPSGHSCDLSGSRTYQRHPR